MVGDTNLFLSNADTNTITGTIAEVEIMIAEESQRGKKLGYHALTLMMNYAIEHLRINQFEAKIKCDNEPSINLFQKLGFKEKTRSQVFNEITFVLDESNARDFKSNASPIILNAVINKYKHK